jgi:hypothetical protein
MVTALQPFYMLLILLYLAFFTVHLSGESNIVGDGKWKTTTPMEHVYQFQFIYMFIHNEQVPLILSESWHQAGYDSLR